MAYEDPDQPRRFMSGARFKADSLTVHPDGTITNAAGQPLSWDGVVREVYSLNVDGGPSIMGAGLWEHRVVPGPGPGLVITENVGYADERNPDNLTGDTMSMSTTAPTRTQLVEYHHQRIQELTDEAVKFRNAAWAFEAMADRLPTLPMGPGYWTQAVKHMQDVALASAATLTEQQRKCEVEAARLREEGVR